jgi:hypothetical protein
VWRPLTRLDDTGVEYEPAVDVVVRQLPEPRGAVPRVFQHHECRGTPAAPGHTGDDDCAGVAQACHQVPITGWEDEPLGEAGQDVLGHQPGRPRRLGVTVAGGGLEVELRLLHEEDRAPRVGDEVEPGHPMIDTITSLRRHGISWS